MNRLEQLPQIVDHRLGGLTADPRLYTKIRLAAASKQDKARLWHKRPALVACLTVAVCLCVGLWAAWPALVDKNSGAPLLDSYSAGTISQSDIHVQALDVPAGSLSVGDAAGNATGYRNLYASDRSGNFPLIMVGNAVYRMLISPTDMRASLLGNSLGEVTEYMLEPALSSGGIVSNRVSAGQTVYEVKGMGGAAVAAYVSGSVRVFQRVSFAGAAVLGSETLESTLASAADVTAMELTGQGVISDAATAQNLMQTLLSNAVYQSAASGTDDTRSLQIALDNGLILQMMVGQDTVSACGTWSCPEFFAAYAAAAAEQ